jgi:hypothetical protein
MGLQQVLNIQGPLMNLSSPDKVPHRHPLLTRVLLLVAQIMLHLSTLHVQTPMNMLLGEPEVVLEPEIT